MTVFSKRHKSLTREDVNHICRVGVILFLFHFGLLIAYHLGGVSILPCVLLWAFVIRTCWRSVQREADMLFAATDKATHHADKDAKAKQEAAAAAAVKDKNA